MNELTGSTPALAAMAIALALPPLTIGLVAGTLADRMDRRRLMLASDLARAIIVLGFVLIGTAGQLPLLLLLLALAQASVGTFFNPARGALLPRLVPAEGLLAANSIAQATRVVAGVGGTAIAGVMIGATGLYWPAFVLDALTFLVSFALVLGIPAALGGVPEARPGRVPTGIRADLVEGLRLIAGARVLWVTVATLGAAMLGPGSVNLLFVPLLVNELQVPEAWFGPVELAQSTSMVLSAGIVAALAARLAAPAIVVASAPGRCSSWPARSSSWRDCWPPWPIEPAGRSGPPANRPPPHTSNDRRRRRRASGTGDYPRRRSGSGSAGRMVTNNGRRPSDSHGASPMIRTYRICQTHGHRQQDSLRGIFRRLEREIVNQPPRLAPLASRSLTAPRRLAF